MQVPAFDAICRIVSSDKAGAARMVSRIPAVVHARNPVGETPLHYLAVENDAAAVAWLINNGADVNTQNRFGKTPLMDAAYLAHVDICELLLAHGAKTELRSVTDETAISIAAEAGHELVVRVILSRISVAANLNAWFSDLSAARVLDSAGGIADMLTQRGLRHPWPSP